MERMENGNFCLFAANQNGRLLAVFCKQKMENGGLFSLVSKQQTVNTPVYAYWFSVSMSFCQFVIRHN
jgi:hypothetical protein